MLVKSFGQARPVTVPPLFPQPGSIDSNNQLFAPGGRLSWGKGSSGGSGAKPSDAGMEAALWSCVVTVWAPLEAKCYRGSFQFKGYPRDT